MDPLISTFLDQAPLVAYILALTLTLRDGAARALDVGAGPRMAAVEEQDARPDADCELVLSAEIMVESGEEKLLDSRG